MEQNEFDSMMEDWLTRRQDTEVSRNEKTDWAVRAGITDGARPQAFVTQEEAAEMLYRALEYFFRRIICFLQEK